MDVPPSPFVVGRPLQAHEALFGRAETFALVHAALARFESVNLVGERRMGKTSFLNHLLDNPAHRPAPGTPPLLLVRVDLQGVSDAGRFYGLALRGILEALPNPAALPGAAERLQSLQSAPHTDSDALARLLRQLADTGLARPVLLLDEFEQLLEPQHRAAFAVPGFFDGLRALITANQLALLVASRLPLAEHFQRLPAAMTSTFPSYLTPQHLRALDEAAADSLLLQGTACGLGLEEVRKAREWAGGHPCRLQCAGQAWYEARRFHHDTARAKQRYDEFQGQNCLVHALQPSWRQRRQQVCDKLRGFGLGLAAVPVSAFNGVMAVGSRVKAVSTWLIGAIAITTLVGVLIGKIDPANLLDWLKTWKAVLP